MFICNKCGQTFSEPHVSRENIPYGNGYVQGLAHSSCPYCHGDFKEAKQCEYCGKDFAESRNDVTCEDCLDELELRFSNILHNNFTEHERELLNMIYEGKNLE